MARDRLRPRGRARIQAAKGWSPISNHPLIRFSSGPKIPCDEGASNAMPVMQQAAAVGHGDRIPTVLRTDASL